MTAPVYDPDFIDRFPELATDDVARQGWITRRLAFVYGRLSSRWGDAKEEAALLQVAHHQALYLARAQEGRGVTGSIIQEKVGDIERRFSSSSSSQGRSAGDWSLSDYGREYLELRGSTIVTFGYYG